MSDDTYTHDGYTYRLDPDKVTAAALASIDTQPDRDARRTLKERCVHGDLDVHGVDAEGYHVLAVGRTPFARVHWTRIAEEPT